MRARRAVTSMSPVIEQSASIARGILEPTRSLSISRTRSPLTARRPLSKSQSHGSCDKSRGPTPLNSGSGSTGMNPLRSNGSPNARRLPGSACRRSSRPGEIRAVHAVAPRLRLAPLVESAVGLSHLAEIAASPGVVWLHLGELDLAADLGVTIRKGDELAAYRAMVVLASRAADLPGPPAPVSRELINMAAFETSTRSL